MDDQASSPDTSAFPAETVTWLAGNGGRTVLTIGGPALEAALREPGNDVRRVAADELLPLPAADHTVDVVVVADELPADLMEVARVLRPGGHLALVVSDRDRRIPWARKLDAAIGAEVRDAPAASLVSSSLFGFVDETTQRSWQVVNRESLAALLPTLPALAGLAPADRAERVAAALALYDDYGRGVDGMQLPWVLRCYRATVVENAYLPPRPRRDPAATEESVAEADESLPDTPAAATPPDTEVFTFSADEFDDTGMLLIDFR
jgi:SAM-dependent methyltransferase